MNGKSIEIDNTDAEGRLVLSGEFALLNVACSADAVGADALYYGSSEFKSDTIIDVATLTGYVRSTAKTTPGPDKHDTGQWITPWGRPSQASSQYVFTSLA